VTLTNVPPPSINLVLAGAPHDLLAVMPQLQQTCNVQLYKQHGPRVAILTAVTATVVTVSMTCDHTSA